MPDELIVTRAPVSASDGGLGPFARLGRLLSALLAHDRAVVLLLVALAAATRLPGLVARGSWDADQGHDMEVLRAFVRDGVIPLLGPPTSIGDVHHGAAWYFLLAPFAWFSGSDPTAIVGAIAVAGIGAVVATWWLARMIGGPAAGLVAGLALAISPAAIEESTFIWNPNPIPLVAALALGAAWRARTTGRPAWWTVALIASGLVMQLHVLGVALLPAVLALAVVETRRRGPRRLAGPVLLGLAGIALLYVPLLVHELGHDFEETRRALAFLAGPRDQQVLDPFERFVFVLFRSVGWPLVGLVTRVPTAASVVFAVALGLIAWRTRSARGEEGVAVRWLAGTLAWSVLVLTFLAPSLATVVEGLPNDHYHAFLDPVVVTLVALAAVALIGGSPAGVRASTRTAGVMTGGGAPGSDGQSSVREPRVREAVDRTARGLLLLALGGWAALAISRWPPPAADGGWPAALVAGKRVVAIATAARLSPDAAIGLLGIPQFKGPEAIGYPLQYLDRRTVDLRLDARAQIGLLVIPCDRLFESILHERCAGRAEELTLDYLGRSFELVEVFDLSPRTSISVYVPTDAAASRIALASGR